MTIEKPFRVNDLHILASPTGVHYGIPGRIREYADTIENLAEAFENHPGQGITNIWSLSMGVTSSEMQGFCVIVAEALKTASLREDDLSETPWNQKFLGDFLYENGFVICLSFCHLCRVEGPIKKHPSWGEVAW